MSVVKEGLLYSKSHEWVETLPDGTVKKMCIRDSSYSLKLTFLIIPQSACYTRVRMSKFARKEGLFISIVCKERRVSDETNTIAIRPQRSHHAH